MNLDTRLFTIAGRSFDCSDVIVAGVLRGD
jgi:hypothetical protein